MTKSQIRDSEKTRVLKLDGELTIQHADEFKAMLKGSLDAADFLTIDIESATSVHFACLQLLCSAHRTSTRLGKSITFSAEPPAPIKEAVEKAGYRRINGCAVGDADTCLWKEVSHG